MNLSYTQNLEDYHLSLAFAGQAKGIYLDVGGGHPIADNVTCWFYERGWSGVVVEPQADLVALHRRLRPRDRVFEGVVSRASGPVTFHAVERFHGLSTTVEAFAEQASGLGTTIRRETLAGLSLADLCARESLAEIDILKVDVEGAEADVFAGADFARFRPRVIVAEAIAPGSGEPAWQAWEPGLIAAGYDFVLFDTLNRFYVARECSDIAARFPRERAPWDSCVHMYEIGRAPVTARHPGHRLARDLARGLWASLPWLDPALLARLVLRGQGIAAPSDDAVQELAGSLGDEAGLLKLGLIACGYDGGQIHPEEEDPAVSSG